MSKSMRVIHRYLGFFLAGIMTVYALSGTVMIFRTTNFLKQNKTVEMQLQPNIPVEQLGEKLRIRELKATGEEGDVIKFNDGSYNKKTGLAVVTRKELPYFLDKMTNMHKATTNSPLFFLNIFFGASLLFFVVSAFFMFAVKSSNFKKGLYYTAGGIVLAIIIILF